MVLTAASNTYPYGQCTWWANNRFHEVTGTYVGWMGDAHSWASMAMGGGWQVTRTPVQSPQIICLQPFVQGAGFLGHVGYVESVQNAGTVIVSNMNWGFTRAEQSSVQNVTFYTGPGVQFISLGGSPVPSTSTLVAHTAGFSNPFDFSFLTDAMGKLSVLASWLSNPVRIIKMSVGVLLVLIAIVLLFFPDIKDKAIDAVKMGVMFA